MRHVAISVITGVVVLVGTAIAEPLAEPPHEVLAVDLIATTPPAPIVDHVRIEVEPESRERVQVRSVTLEPRDVAADIASFELTIIDELGRQTLAIPRDTTYVYQPELRVMRQRVRVDVRAIDTHGARSMPTTVAVDVEVAHRYRCGLGPMIVVFMYGFAALLFAGIVIAVRSTRRWRAARGEGELVPPLVADCIARATLRRAASASVASVAGVISALVLDHQFLAVLIAFVAIMPLASLLGARRIARELDRQRARAELRGTLLVVSSPDGQARVHASRRVIARARQQVVPTSIAR